MKQGKMIITKQKRSNPEAEVVKEEIVDSPKRLCMDSPESLARIDLAKRKVINLGNYETLHVEVSVSLPCFFSDDAIFQTFRKAHHLVELHLAAELQDVKVKEKDTTIDDMTWTDNFESVHEKGKIKPSEEDEDYSLEDFD